MDVVVAIGFAAMVAWVLVILRVVPTDKGPQE